MRLKRIEIENFRRINRVDITFEPATFIIGPNNYAKSSIIDAVEALLSLEKEKVRLDDFREKPDGVREDNIIITGHFGPISAEVASSRGFKGRVIQDTYVYRKTFRDSAKKPEIETLEYPSSIKKEFTGVKSVADLINVGITPEVIEKALGLEGGEQKLKKGWQRSLPEVLDFDTATNPDWVLNPGGIPQNVISKLPRVIRIPPFTDVTELESQDKKHKLGECLSILFEDLIADNPLAAEIQTNLCELENQMNPETEGSIIWTICNEVNNIISDVFPECGIEIVPSLQGVVDILKPKYDISLYSNIKTKAGAQGTGLVRTAIFSMLRYHATMKKERDIEIRPLIVAFEEPELYLHPSAGNLLRDTIYSLGRSDQIICTTHSPWMIDLTRDPQSLIKMIMSIEDSITNINYGVSSKLLKLPNEDIGRVKMLQTFDDEVARVFFSEEVVIVEGDSEFLVIKATLKLLRDSVSKPILSRFQIVKARGKESLMSIAKYLKDLNIELRVMFDRDKSTEGSEQFENDIIDVVGDESRVVILEDNLERVLGYETPSRDKPFKAYQKATEWETWGDVPDKWAQVVCKLFSINGDSALNEDTDTGGIEKKNLEAYNSEEDG